MTSCGVVMRCGRPKEHRGHHGGFRPIGRGELEVTPGQLRVLRLIATGLSQAEVAERLGISDQTVKNHLGLAYDALGTRSAIGAFVSLGWLTLPEPQEEHA